MQVLEFGDITKRKIIFINGFQLPVEIFTPYIEEYKNDFHILIPIFPEHNSKENKPFSSFELLAEEFEQYYITKYGHEVHAAWGISMGGVFLATLWQNQKLNFKNIIFDGSSLIPINKFVSTVLIKYYLYLTHKAQNRKKWVLSQAVKKIINKENLNEFLYILDNMSDDTIINMIRATTSFQFNDIAKLKGSCHYFYGSNIDEILGRWSANYLKNNYSSLEVKSFKGKSHCEVLLYCRELMIAELSKIFY